MKAHRILGIVGVALLIGAGTASAQTVGGGAKFGMNFATITGDVGLEPGSSKSTLKGVIGGGFLTVGGDMIAFQPEVLYSQEGVTLSFRQGSTSIDAKAKVGVTHIPLLLRVGPKAGKAASGYFLVGPDIGFISSAKMEVLGVTQDFKDELATTVFGIDVGGGMTVSHFLVEARYAFGVSDVNKVESPLGKNRSNVFSILGGFVF